MAYAAIAMAAIQLWGSYRQAETVKEQAKLNDRIAKMNAKYAELDAWEAEKMGYTQVSRYQNAIDSTLSKQKTIQAAQGIDSGFGTAAELEEETKLTGFLNSLDLIKQAQANAKGLRIEASNIRLGSFMQQAQAGAQASAIQRQGIMQAGQTGLSGYAKATKGTSALEPESGGSTVSSSFTNRSGMLTAGDSKGGTGLLGVEY